MPVFAGATRLKRKNSCSFAVRECGARGLFCTLGDRTIRQHPGQAMSATDAFADRRANQLRRRGEELSAKATAAVARLRAIAAALELSQVEAALQASLTGLERPEFKVMTLGRFKNGKSTLLNAMLGRLEHPLPEMPELKGAPLPMDDVPATLRLTTIRFGETPKVMVVYRDGLRETQSLRWLIGNAELREMEEADVKAFDGVMEFELHYPFASGRDGVVLIDSPGTAEAGESTEIALRALNEADTAIVMLRSDSLAAGHEVEFVNYMRAHSHLRTFFTS